MKSAACVCAFSFVASCFAAASVAVALPPPDALQAALDRRTALAPGTGIVVGIIDHGNVTTYLSGSSGNARALDEHTLFEIGSATKTFTATLLAIAMQAHQVALADPISKDLPKSVRAPSRGPEPITLLSLAEQRSGLPRIPDNLSDVAGPDPYADYTIADTYAFLSGYSLTRRPGEAYEYSNLGIGVLGIALANAAHTTYPALLRSRVFAPLEMTDSSIATPSADDGPPLATGHDADGNPVPPWHFDAIAPAGGIRSSLSDMMKYLRCNMGSGPLESACAFAQRPRANGEAGYTIGLVWRTSIANGTISHGGDTAGFHSEIAISRDRTTGIVVMSNGPLITDIAAHAIDPSRPLSSCPSHVDAADEDASAYRGVYCARGIGVAFRVFPSAVADSVLIRVEGQPSLSYAKIGDDRYSNATVGATATFVRNEGAIVGIRFAQAGQVLHVHRLDSDGNPVPGNLDAAPAARELGNAALREYVGTYEAAGGLKFIVTLRGSVLYVALTGQPAVPVYASARDRFFYTVVDAQIAFGRDAAGAVSTLTLHQNGTTIDARREPR